MGMQLMGVYLMGVHLIGVYLIGVYLTDVHLIGVYFIGGCLVGVYLVGVYLTGVLVTGMHLIVCTSLVCRYGHAPHWHASHRRVHHGRRRDHGCRKGIKFSFVQYRLCEGASAFGYFVIGTFCTNDPAIPAANIYDFIVTALAITAMIAQSYKTPKLVDGTENTPALTCR
jgi:hypothetical protein